MADLGHSRFIIVGHDRGARIGYRLALDYLDSVCGFAALAVIPTLDAFDAIDATFAINAFHWFMLAQPNGLPQRLLAGDPIGFVDAALTNMAGSSQLSLNPTERRSTIPPCAMRFAKTTAPQRPMIVRLMRLTLRQARNYSAPFWSFGQGADQKATHPPSTSGADGLMTSLADPSTEGICFQSFLQVR
jgi:pimeloyl-ACP methyl ester carboxylesterase